MPKTDRRSAKRKCLQAIICEFGVAVGANITKDNWNPAWRRMWRSIDKLALFPMREKK